jgi:hypothetical protein
MYPKGTILKHKDGSTSVADGNTSYDTKKWSVTTAAQTEKKTKVTTPSTNVPSVEIPESLANDPDYKSLNSDNQALAAYIISKSTTGNKTDTQALSDALTLATSQANTYWTEKLNIIKSTLKESLGEVDTDLATTERELMLRKARIEEDLKTNKNDYSLDEQSELATQAENLDAKIQTTRENMAARGLTSSSIRNQAEERLNNENSDVVESTTRKYERATREAETLAGRNVVDIANQIQDATQKANSEKKNKVSTTEQYIGSGALGDLPAANPYLTGNITGSMVGDKTSDILTRQRALLAPEGIKI